MLQMLLIVALLLLPATLASTPPWRYSPPPPLTRSWHNLTLALLSLPPSPITHPPPSHILPTTNLGSGKFSQAVYNTTTSHIIKSLPATLPTHRLRREIYATLAALPSNPHLTLCGIKIMPVKSLREGEDGEEGGEGGWEGERSEELRKQSGL